MDMDKVMDKLSKLFELAQRGEGGEADNAKAMFLKLCEKYKVSPDTFGSEVPKEYRYGYNSNEEYRLLLQLIRIATGDNNKTTYKWKDGRKKKEILVEFTIVERVMFEEMLDFYKPLFETELSKALDLFLTAFLVKHSLFLKTKEDEKKGSSGLDQKDIDLLRGLISNMDDKEFRKKIG